MSDAAKNFLNSLSYYFDPDCGYPSISDCAEDIRNWIIEGVLDNLLAKEITPESVFNAYQMII